MCVKFQVCLTCPTGFLPANTTFFTNIWREYFFPNILRVFYQPEGEFLKSGQDWANTRPLLLKTFACTESPTSPLECLHKVVNIYPQKKALFSKRTKIVPNYTLFMGVKFGLKILHFATLRHTYYYLVIRFRKYSQFYHLQKGKAWNGIKLIVCLPLLSMRFTKRLHKWQVWIIWLSCFFLSRLQDSVWICWVSKNFISKHLNPISNILIGNKFLRNSFPRVFNFHQINFELFDEHERFCLITRKWISWNVCFWWK